MGNLNRGRNAEDTIVVDSTSLRSQHDVYSLLNSGSAQLPAGITLPGGTITVTPLSLGSGAGATASASATVSRLIVQ